MSFPPRKGGVLPHLGRVEVHVGREGGEEEVCDQLEVHLLHCLTKKNHMMTFPSSLFNIFGLSSPRITVNLSPYKTENYQPKFWISNLGWKLSINNITCLTKGTKVFILYQKQTCEFVFETFPPRMCLKLKGLRIPDSPSNSRPLSF